jgi:hypothetical protein
MTLCHIHCSSHGENQGGTLIFQRTNSNTEMCLQNLQEEKQGVPMMLVEVSVNLYNFGFHIKDIQINQMIIFQQPLISTCRFWWWTDEYYNPGLLLLQIPDTS